LDRRVVGMRECDGKCKTGVKSLESYDGKPVIVEWFIHKGEHGDMMTKVRHKWKMILNT